mmetsp:Transcript_5590/g.9848  ORF Transcript_5590/g.9848 Transcript_5590/m.9848 type:complete len:140 (-) Transcript_5590:592-1011(-)
MLSLRYSTINMTREKSAIGVLLSQHTRSPTSIVKLLLDKDIDRWVPLFETLSLLSSRKQKIWPIPKDSEQFCSVLIIVRHVSNHLWKQNVGNLSFRDFLNQSLFIRCPIFLDSPITIDSPILSIESINFSKAVSATHGV